MQRIQSYRDLVAWQRAMDLVVMCYRLTEGFPASEQFGLSFEIHKSAVSIPSNIAEGYQRKSTGAYLHHLSIARGSQGELGTQLMIGQRLGYSSHSKIQPVLEITEEVGRLLYGLIQSVEGTDSRPDKAFTYRVPNV